jgi:phenylalanyl-tRNA synthetase alpha chain
VRIEEIRVEAAAAIDSASSSAELEELRVRYLGRKAELTAILRGIAGLPAEERGKIGGGANEARKELEALIESRAGSLDASELESRLSEDRIDVTLPGAPPRPVGHIHLITRTTRQIEDVMVGLGYKVMEGPEVEHDYYNFTALNHPPGHPARMLQDTFYVQSDPEVLLRTHTSPVQTRSMESQPPPIFMIAPGKVYRRDSDATHSPMFHQVEGLAIGEGITLADLQGTLDEMLRAIFGGAGMVDPNVLGFVESNGYDPERVQGFAFGMGVERIAMLRHGVPDLRRFFDNDVRVLEQFS